MQKDTVSNLRRLDDLLKEDLEFEKFYNLKRNLMSYFDLDKIIKVIFEHINASELVDFTSERQARHVSVSDPVFKVYINDVEAWDKYAVPMRTYEKLLNNDSELHSYRNSVIHGEVINPCSIQMYEQFHQLRESGKLDEGTVQILKELPDQESLKDMFLINMFKITIQETKAENPIVNIEYII